MYSTGNSAQCYVAAQLGGESEGEWDPVYVWLRPFAAHLKLSQHCQSAVLQYEIKCLEKLIWLLVNELKKGKMETGRPVKRLCCA